MHAGHHTFGVQASRCEPHTVTTPVHVCDKYDCGKCWKILGITTCMVPLLRLLCQVSTHNTAQVLGCLIESTGSGALNPHAKNIALQLAEPYLFDRLAFQNNPYLFCMPWLLCQCC